MKKGFTLVELIAIIILIGIVSLITFPTISNMIRKAQINNDKQLAKSIVDEAAVLYDDYVLSNRQNQLIDKNIYDMLTTDGKPSYGSLIINSYGNIQLVVKIDDRCYKKDYNEVEINLVEEDVCAN